MFGINSSDKEEIKNASEKLYRLLEKYGKEQMQIMPPLPAPIDRIKYRYRWRIIAKCKLNNKIIDIINEALEEYYEQKYKKTRVIVDVNPNNMA
jgi:primosomal protein N' (replication factor Y)